MWNFIVSHWWWSSCHRRRSISSGTISVKWTADLDQNVEFIINIIAHLRIMSTYKWLHVFANCIWVLDVMHVFWILSTHQEDTQNGRTFTKTSTDAVSAIWTKACLLILACKVTCKWRCVRCKRCSCCGRFRSSCSRCRWFVCGINRLVAAYLISGGHSHTQKWTEIYTISNDLLLGVIIRKSL